MHLRRLSDLKTNVVSRDIDLDKLAFSASRIKACNLSLVQRGEKENISIPAEGSVFSMIFPSLSMNMADVRPVRDP